MARFPLLFSILFFTFYSTAQSMVLDFNLDTDLSVNLIFWLDQAVSESSEEDLLELQNTINRAFAGKVQAMAILDNEKYQNMGLKLKSNHIEIFQDTLNCVDFSSTKSFFKEKYYLKLLLNSQIFQSKFFYQLKQFGIGQNYLGHLIRNDKNLKINFNFPGDSDQTNLNVENNNYFYQSSFKSLKQSGGVVEFSASRFLPEVYITVFSVLFGLILLLIKFIF